MSQVSFQLPVQPQRTKFSQSVKKRLFQNVARSLSQSGQVLARDLPPSPSISHYNPRSPSQRLSFDELETIEETDLDSEEFSDDDLTLYSYQPSLNEKSKAPLRPQTPIAHSESSRFQGFFADSIMQSGQILSKGF